MTVRHVTVDKPLFKLGMTLGEGALWDTRTNRLHFVDIDNCRVYTYEPASKTLGYETFPGKVSCLALTESGDGLVGTDEVGFIHIPASSLPFPPTNSATPKRVNHLGPTIPLRAQEKRFNDGAVDPAGRFLAGTMGREHEQVVGRMYSLQKNGKGWEAPLVLDNITCTNGMGWSPDGKTMYFTDSWIQEIAAFDYDVATGTMSNRRTFSRLVDPAYGEPDGLCMDAAGGVWSARWQSGKVVRFDPTGRITDEVDIPTAWHVTCVVFGGDRLDELYVTTADTGYNGEVIPERVDGGSLFVVAGLGYTGVERTRFKDA